MDLNIGVQGVDITVWSSNGDFSAMGYIVDHLDSLIDEWFPGVCVWVCVCVCACVRARTAALPESNGCHFAELS